jgi:hypothetical protein
LTPPIPILNKLLLPALLIGFTNVHYCPSSGRLRPDRCHLYPNVVTRVVPELYSIFFISQ